MEEGGRQRSRGEGKNIERRQNDSSNVRRSSKDRQTFLTFGLFCKLDTLSEQDTRHDNTIVRTDGRGVRVYIPGCVSSRQGAVRRFAASSTGRSMAGG